MKVKLVGLVSLLFLVLGASTAGATETIVDLVMPVIYAQADSPSSGPVTALDDFSDELETLVKAEARSGGGHASGQVGLTDVLVAGSAGQSVGMVELFVDFTVDDPQQRPQVKTILEFKAIASAGTPLPGFNASAGVEIAVGQSDYAPFQLRVDSDTLSSQIISAPHVVSQLFGLQNYAIASLDYDSNGQLVVPVSLCAGTIWMNGQVVSQHPAAVGCSFDTESGRLELTHAPGTYLMHILVYAGGNSFAISDPVWRPHPDNPDVVVTRHAPTGSPSAPLAGMSPDDLAARGIDPTPFIELGFFDTTPVSRTLTALGAADVWVGFKNSDDVGLRLDLRAEVFLGTSKIGEGQVNNVPSGSSGFRNALLQTIPLTLSQGPVPVPADAELRLSVSARRTCSGGGHTSGVARLWYNGNPVDTGRKRDAGTRFDAAIDGTEATYYLRDNFELSTNRGSSRQFIDTAVNSSAACPNRPFTTFGTWSLTLP